MKNILLIFCFIISNTTFCQDLKLIYVDNSISISRASKLCNQLENVILSNDKPGYLILGNDSLSYNLKYDDVIDILDEICLTNTKEEKNSSLYNIIFDQLYTGNVFNGLEQIKSIELHLFFNIKTYVINDYFKSLLNRVIVDNMLDPDKTNINVYLDTYGEKDIYSQYITKNKLEKNYKDYNIKIIKY
tara:strand:+ start:514 stop:1077 length:564 start_codon:yes stop_codon:yes gene_type:complete